MREAGTTTSSPVTVAVDLYGTVKAWNDTALRLLGHGSVDLMARTVRTLWAAQAPGTLPENRPSARSWTFSPEGTDGESRDRRLVVHAEPLRGAAAETLWVLSIRPEGDSADAEHHWARRRLAIMNEAGVRIGTTLDLGRTAEELAEVGIDHFADFTFVELLDSVLHDTEGRPAPDPDLMTFRRVALKSVMKGCPEAVVPIGGTQYYPKASPVGTALATGRGSVHQASEESLHHWERYFPDRARSARRHGTHSVMVVPLQARGVALGVAVFGRHRTATPFGDEDLLLAEELAALAAVCVDNARLYTREHATALALQRSLLPRGMTHQCAVETAARYLPASTPAGLGGDWYDVIPLSGARVALVVGDVVGHGLRASATMGRLRTAVRTLADVDLPPDELLTQLNDVVLGLETEETEGDDLSGSPTAGEICATCLYVVYDPVARRCSLAGAGHVLPAIVIPGADVEFPDLPVGPPLGVSGLPFEMAEFHLPEASVLALFTKGLLWARHQDIDTGLHVMGEVLAARAATLEDTCDALVDALLKEGVRDDAVLLLARTRALDVGQVATWQVPPDPAAVPDVRKSVVERLADWDLEDVSFTVELVVSELVTNAIRYGGAPIELRLIRDTALICEVSDGGNTAPHLRRARVFDEGGRGLLLVAQLTDRWGSRQTRRGKTIWAEQALPVRGSVSH